MDQQEGGRLLRDLAAPVHIRNMWTKIQQVVAEKGKLNATQAEFARRILLQDKEKVLEMPESPTLSPVLLPAIEPAIEVEFRKMCLDDESGCLEFREMSDELERVAIELLEGLGQPLLAVPGRPGWEVENDKRGDVLDADLHASATNAASALSEADPAPPVRPAAEQGEIRPRAEKRRAREREVYWSRPEICARRAEYAREYQQRAKERLREKKRQMVGQGRESAAQPAQQPQPALPLPLPIPLPLPCLLPPRPQEPAERTTGATRILTTTEKNQNQQQASLSSMGDETRPSPPTNSTSQPTAACANEVVYPNVSSTATATATARGRARARTTTRVTIPERQQRVMREAYQVQRKSDLKDWQERRKEQQARLAEMEELITTRVQWLEGRRKVDTNAGAEKDKDKEEAVPPFASFIEWREVKW